MRKNVVKIRLDGYLSTDGKSLAMLAAAADKAVPALIEAAGGLGIVVQDVKSECRAMNFPEPRPAA
jgi:hypothetical protein